MSFFIAPAQSRILTLTSCCIIIENLTSQNIPVQFHNPGKTSQKCRIPVAPSLSQSGPSRVHARCTFDCRYTLGLEWDAYTHAPLRTWNEPKVRHQHNRGNTTRVWGLMVHDVVCASCTLPQIVNSRVSGTVCYWIVYILSGVASTSRTLSFSLPSQFHIYARRKWDTRILSVTDKWTINLQSQVDQRGISPWVGGINPWSLGWKSEMGTKKVCPESTKVNTFAV